MNRLLIAAMFAFVAPVAAADAAISAKDMARCQAMSATFAPKQKEIAGLKDARDAQALIVEERGEAWDDAEILRNASAAHAEAADSAKAAYEAERAKLVRLEQGLQAAVSGFNADIEAYNRSCASQE